MHYQLMLQQSAGFPTLLHLQSHQNFCLGVALVGVTQIPRHTPLLSKPFYQTV